MEKNLFTEAQRYLSSQHKDKRRSQVLRIVAVVVVFVTIYALILPAVTMSNEVECGMEEHIHTESCYEIQDVPPQPVLTCTAGASGAVMVHTHDEFCYDSLGNLICDLAEMEAHVHGAECYREHRELICTEIPDPGHTHTASCYAQERGEDLICGLETGGPGHVHTIECYTRERSEELVCGQEETGPSHIHSDDCYRQERTDELICGQEEDEESGHTHSENCYRLVPVKQELKCTQEERDPVTDGEGNVVDPGHRHGSECWKTEEELRICGQEESLGHTHTALCWQVEDNRTLTCGQEETETHTHNDRCYEWIPRLTCQEEERAGGHVHDDACYEITQLFVCLKQEVIPHTHGGSCYDESGALLCEMSEIAAHQHTAACFTIPEGDPVPTQVLVCGMEEHTHDKETCFVKLPSKEEQTFYCDREEHIHTLQECFFESGSLRCTVVEHAHDLTCLEPRAEESEDPEESPDPAESAAPAVVEGVELDSLRFEYDTENFHMVYFLNGFAQAAESQTGPEQLQQNSGAASGDPFPVPSSMELVEITNQMVPLAAKARALSLAALEDGAADEFSGMTEPGSEAEPEGTAVSDSSQPDLGEQEGMEVLPEFTPAPADDGVVLLDPAMVEAEVVVLDRDSEEYRAMAEYAARLSEDQNSLDLWAYSFAATVDGRELDLTQCTVDVEITFTEEYRAYLNSLGQAQSGSEDGAVTLMAISEEKQVLETTELSAESAESAESTPAPRAMGMSLGAARTMSAQGMASGSSSGASSGASTGEHPAPDIKYTVTNASKLTGFAGLTSSVPDFQMEYYAYLLRPKTGNSTNGLPFIDTSADANGGTAKLPENGKAVKRTYLEVASKDGHYEVVFHKQLHEIYTMEGTLPYEPSQSEKFTTEYLDRVRNTWDPVSEELSLNTNPHYELAEIWVQQPTTDGSTYWRIYTEDKKATEDNLKEINSATGKDGTHSYELVETDPRVETEPKTGGLAGIKYVNNEKAYNEDPKNRILIYKDAKIRMVYKVVEMNFDNNAAFFDYDISTKKPTTVNGVTTLYSNVDTAAQGINSTSNYTTSGTKIAFGNKNTYTGLGTVTWNGQQLNKYNNNNTATQGCTFGLVSKAYAGTLTFSSGVRQIALFDSTTLKGKTDYLGSSVGFRRQGDTFILTSATVKKDKEGAALSSTGNLDQFIHPQRGTDGPIFNGTNNHGEYRDAIWTNSFWPMDSVQNNDPLFGLTTASGGFTGEQKFSGCDETAKYTAKSGNLPRSDDGKDHNSYFGMTFQVGFNVDANYCGPLEYYFYGDDDLWVYLDGKLVCDIGGVHSSEGEYVNLWDHVPAGSGDHTLTFFYTERGASGSTCWMQFTVPNATTAPVRMTPSDTRLRIEKKVEGNLSPAEDVEYKFNLQLDTENSVPYTKYCRDGQEVTGDIQPKGSDNIISLRNGEYIIVSNLAASVGYRVTEVFDGGKPPENCKPKWDITYTNYEGEQKKDSGTGTSTGDGYHTVSSGANEVLFINTYIYTLPETGGAGSWYTMAGLPLAAATFCLWYKKKSQGEGAEDGV